MVLKFNEYILRSVFVQPTFLGIDHTSMMEQISFLRPEWVPYGSLKMASEKNVSMLSETPSM